MSEASLGETLIPAINKLQDIFSQVIVASQRGSMCDRIPVAGCIDIAKATRGTEPLHVSRPMRSSGWTCRKWLWLGARAAASPASWRRWWAGTSCRVAQRSAPGAPCCSSWCSLHPLADCFTAAAACPTCTMT